MERARTAFARIEVLYRTDSRAELDARRRETRDMIDDLVRAAKAEVGTGVSR